MLWLLRGQQFRTQHIEHRRSAPLSRTQWNASRTRFDTKHARHVLECEYTHNYIVHTIAGRVLRAQNRGSVFFCAPRFRPSYLETFVVFSVCCRRALLCSDAVARIVYAHTRTSCAQLCMQKTCPYCVTARGPRRGCRRGCFCVRVRSAHMCANGKGTCPCACATRDIIE